MAIVINKPYIEAIDGGRVRLCSKIEGDMNDVLYYEVDEKYAQYLCDDRADAFLTGLLHSAMYNNQDIICNCDVSSQLLFQLKTYFVPIVSEYMDDLNPISIQAPVTTTPVESAGGVGTGLSGGVDSFYTAVKYSKPDMGEARITHVMFNNIVSADNNEERIRKLHNEDAKDKRQIAEELGLEFIELYSNLYAFYKFPGIFNHYFSMPYASAVLALQKLFSIYYFSSSYTLDKFSVNYKKIPSGAPFDIFTLDCVSNKNTKFYSAGIEVSRYQKMCEFVDNKVAQRHLQVCGVAQSFGGDVQVDNLNCGSCMKCSRAIVTLRLLGQLDNYRPLFDMRRYDKNINRFIGRELAGDKGAFVGDIVKGLKQQKLLTPTVRIWKAIYAIKFRLSKVASLRRLVAAIRNK